RSGRRPRRAREESRRRRRPRPAGGVRVHRFSRHRLGDQRPADRGDRRERREGAEGAGAPGGGLGRTARRAVGAARLRRRGGPRLSPGRAGALRPRRGVGGRAADRGRALKIRVVSVGKDKGPTLELAEEYARRLGRFCELELIEVKGDVLAKVRGEMWALDQRGVELTSEELSRRLTAQMTFCIGGDEGHTDDVRRSARFLWSLSRLTLPHRIARVVVLEQLYRAFEIIRGGPYHK